MLGKNQSLFNLYVLTFLRCSLFQFSKHKICWYLNIHIHFKRLKNYILKYQLILPTHETQFDVTSLIKVRLCPLRLTICANRCYSYVRTCSSGKFTEHSQRCIFSLRGRVFVEVEQVKVNVRQWETFLHLLQWFIQTVPAAKLKIQFFMENNISLTFYSSLCGTL